MIDQSNKNINLRSNNHKFQYKKIYLIIFLIFLAMAVIISTALANILNTKTNRSEVQVYGKFTFCCNAGPIRIGEENIQQKYSFLLLSRNSNETLKISTDLNGRYNVTLTVGEWTAQTEDGRKNLKSFELTKDQINSKVEENIDFDNGMR